MYSKALTVAEVTVVYIHVVTFCISQYCVYNNVFCDDYLGIKICWKFQCKLKELYTCFFVGVILNEILSRVHF